MDISLFLSWQFILVGLCVFCVFYMFNRLIGPALWAFSNRVNNPIWWLRRVLKFLEGIKLIWPPLLGFALGCIPYVSQPAQLKNEHWLHTAVLYGIAGLCSQWVVKGVVKALEARGVDIEFDEDPRTQIRKGRVSKPR